MAEDAGRPVLAEGPPLARSASLRVSCVLVVVGLAVVAVCAPLSFAAGIGPDGNYPAWRIRPLLDAGGAVALIALITLLSQLSRRRSARSRAWLTGTAVALCAAALIVGSVQTRLRWHLGPSLLSALRHLTPPAGATLDRAPYLLSPDGPGLPPDASLTWHIGGRDGCSALTAELGARPGWRRALGEGGPCGWTHLAGRVRIVAFPADLVEGAAPGTIHVVAEPND